MDPRQRSSAKEMSTHPWVTNNSITHTNHNGTDNTYDGHYHNTAQEEGKSSDDYYESKEQDEQEEQEEQEEDADEEEEDSIRGLYVNNAPHAYESNQKALYDSNHNSSNHNSSNHNSDIDSGMGIDKIMLNSLSKK